VQLLGGAAKAAVRGYRQRRPQVADGDVGNDNAFIR
jgi:hypothetical protein